MRLISAHIKNFKGITDWQFKFDAHFNIIKGENGKGKTSVLEALAVGLGGFIAGVNGVKTRHFSINEIQREYHRNGDGSYDIQYNVPIEVSIQAEILDSNTTIAWTRNRNSLQASRSTIQPRKISHYAETITNNPGTKVPIISYHSAARIWAQKKAKSEDAARKKYTRSAGYSDALDEASNMKRLLDWCVRMEQISWQKDRKISEYEATKKAISTFMTYMEPGKDYEVFYDKQLDELMFRESNSLHPVTDLSAGYQSLVWMVFDIAYRMALLNPFLLDDITQTSGVILIDELDMHLHPRWQWNIITALKNTFPNVQFIVTTHSPILFGSADDVLLIDIEQNEIRYDYSHFGIDINTSVRQYQGDYDLPKDIKVMVNDFFDNLDNNNFKNAKSILDTLKTVLFPDSPLLASLQARFEFETIFSEE